MQSRRLRSSRDTWKEKETKRQKTDPPEAAEEERKESKKETKRQNIEPPEAAEVEGQQKQKRNEAKKQRHSQQEKKEEKSPLSISCIKWLKKLYFPLDFLQFLSYTKQAIYT